MSVHRPFPRAVRSLLAGACVAAALLAGAAGAVTPATREEALQALDSAQADRRREAVAALGDLGTMQDAGRLIDALHDADAGVRALAEHSVWRVWMRSDDPAVDALMQSGVRHMEDGRLGLAVDAFTQVIERRPDFAEGWNKRATVYFLMGDYDQSLADCDETLERNPDHFGALSGCGAIYAQREELERAEDFLGRALEVNPNLRGVEQALALVRQRLGKRGRQAI